MHSKSLACKQTAGHSLMAAQGPFQQEQVLLDVYTQPFQNHL